MIDFNSARRQDELRGGISAESLRERLNAIAESFVRSLYGGRARIQGIEARIGNVHGEAGTSLAIELAGANVGAWLDHATGESGGDLIALYRAYMGYPANVDFVLSLKEIASEFLGDPIEIERPPWQMPRARIEADKIKFGIKPAADDSEPLGAPIAEYKYLDVDGTVIAGVTRYEPKTFRPWCYDDAKRWVMRAPDIRPLYHLPELSKATDVVLVEGEGKADALAAYGVVTTSAMQGAKSPIEKTNWLPLGGKRVTIWPDNDQAGLEYAKKLCEKLITLGCKVWIVPIPDGVPAKWDAGKCIREGRDPLAVLATAVEVAKQLKPRVRLLSIVELAAMPPPAWLIDNVIIENGLSMIWGRSGSLKSFVALDMALCVATGLDWHGRKVKRGRVVYLAAEGARGLGGRALGWMKTRGRDLSEPDFKIIPHGLTLVNSGDLDAMITAIGSNPIAMIVIDTLSRTFGGGNPNQPSDMNAFVMACYRLIEATGAQVVVVHHGGKDTDKNELGNEGLRNASDTVIYIRRNTSEVELINDAPKGKQKDYEEFKTIHLQPVKVHYEQNGTELSTLILNADDGQKLGSDESADEPELKFGTVEKKVVDALLKSKQPLGLTRLVLLTNAYKKSVARALENLTEKGLVMELGNEDENHKTWRLA